MSLSLLFSTFANNLLPILLLSGAGFLIGKLLNIDPRPLGRILFYLFSPLLIFDLLLNSELNLSDAFSTVLFTVVTIVTLGLLGFLAGRLFKLNRQQSLAVILVAGIGNNGNYGLPLALFSFGDRALAYASVYFVTTSIISNTLGVFIASLGEADLKNALLGIFKVPMIYAVILAVILRTFGVQLAVPLKRTVDLASGGSIPMMLVLLGIELSRSQWSHSMRALGVGTFMRLIAGPVVGLLFAALFGFQGPLKQAVVMQASMPAAVATTVIAAEYNLEPPLVTALVLLTTVLSPLTLTPLIVLLGR